MVSPIDTNEFEAEDTLTKLNTQLNQSMVLMENATENETPQNKRSKSIKINMKIQPASSSNGTPKTSRKSILKKSDKTNGRKSVDNGEGNGEVDETRMNNNEEERVPVDKSNIPRPLNLEELLQKDALTPESTKATFSWDDISENEDVYIMDIPRTVDPRELEGQVLALGNKSKFKVKDERYCAVSHDAKNNMTFVFNTGKVHPRYKTINMKPAGVITVRRKLSGIPKIKPVQIENSGVPFPKNLKTRHPLFGVTRQGKVRKREIKRSS